MDSFPKLQLQLASFFVACGFGGDLGTGIQPDPAIPLTAAKTAS